VALGCDVRAARAVAKTAWLLGPRQQQQGEEQEEHWCGGLQVGPQLTLATNLLEDGSHRHQVGNCTGGV
jgi:hypothetical protein